MTYTPQTWVDNNPSYPLSAARMNYIESGIEDAADVADQGHLIFTNEAARDAAITSPVQGQMVYLTSPTVPAATGEEEYAPSGVQTIYNGSVWVCVTEVGAYTSNEATTTSTSYTATLSGTPGTNPSVTLVTGTTAFVSIGLYTRHGITGQSTFCSVAISGAGSVSAADKWSVGVNTIAANNQGMFAGKSFVVSGLTAGSNTFALNYRISAAAGSSGSFGQRFITVKGIA